jgi:hypothetical protein
MKPLNLEGQRFHRLLAKERVVGNKWRCVCDCGNERLVRTEYLRNGDTKSCGCLNLFRQKTSKITHGFSKEKRGLGYISWQGMKRRCLNPREKEYLRYGGRGIKICERWLKFENFYADMGPRPSSKHSLDRIDSNGNYEPSNCRWATDIEQARNRRDVHLINVNGKKISAIELLEFAAIKTVIGEKTVASILREDGLEVAIRLRR